jgi:hypothetical protein
MKTTLIICNEADYLQAHLTFIVGKPRPENQVLHNFGQRMTSLLKKWVAAASADLASRSMHPRGLRMAEGGPAKRKEHRLIVR